MAGKSRLSDWLRRRSGDGDDRADAAPAARSREDLRREDLLLSAAAATFSLAPAAHPSGVSGYRCSCDRIGCPTPGMHPVSFAWASQATTDPEKITHWLRGQPLANFITPTGSSHDVLDVPAGAGRIALARLATEDASAVGPVASYSAERLLFFTATRGTPVDEDEWWPCELDCHPETLDEHPGLRWHCRGSYVLLPPSRLPSGDGVEWLPGHGPDRALPDPLPLLEILNDASSQMGHQPEAAAWPL
ncbi:bifunctional DNA primase/polymerase [Actinacidiphila oryziradicis]|uniref:Bifunctional DNA primase/polymerase n=1 Tax=Actinacidiphila oryziradicis TaxID=2571141 RepID=A0A4U0T886_9ACTN|nr:bifunctional DNA primase/polymerase [Actinacidiphila oryziradicis]TKA10235.1 bifunctional DNA primase/polymerase [Actinacidiphila oryziradicis]